MKWETDYLQDVYDVIKGVSRFEGGRIIGTRAPFLVEFFTYIPNLLAQKIAYPIICLIMFVWLTLFYGAFRPGEITADKRTKYDKMKTVFGTQIKFESWPVWSHYLIRLSQYKTNQTPSVDKNGNIGVWCTVCMGSSHPYAKYIKDYFYHRLGNRKNPTGQLGKKDLLFQWPTDEPYTSNDLSTHLKKVLTILKKSIPKFSKLKIPDYTGHIFRIGAATLLAASGVKRWIIQIISCL